MTVANVLFVFGLPNVLLLILARKGTLGEGITTKGVLIWYGVAIFVLTLVWFIASVTLGQLPSFSIVALLGVAAFNLGAACIIQLFEGRRAK